MKKILRFKIFVLEFRQCLLYKNKVDEKILRFKISVVRIKSTNMKLEKYKVTLFR